VTVSYDAFTSAFLAKITEYDLLDLELEDRQSLVDGYMLRAASQFSDICVYDIAHGDSLARQYTFDGATENDVEEIVDIVSDGMVCQWLRQHLYKQENLAVTLNTVDFTHYSPAELTYRITNAYKLANQSFVNRMREYSFRHGDLKECYI